MQRVDLAVIGGGIVGLATALQLQRRFPNESIVVLEKERAVGLHQTGRNSGVLHTGIYYRPGSLKATNCHQGKAAMEQFCREHNIPFDICGKVIVATSEGELPALEKILKRGVANGVDCRRIDRSELHEIEPHANGIAALHVPGAGIIDFRQVAEKISAILQADGHQIVVDGHVRRISTLPDGVQLETNNMTWHAAWAVNCAGLYSDRIARMAGLKPNVRIIPFRGEFYDLLPQAHSLCRNLIYPVPDPRFPFLGVHFTRMISGGVECGPNAVLALAREGYRKSSLHLGELGATLLYPGFWRLSGRYWQVGMGEIVRSFSKRAFVRALRRLVPEIHGKWMRRARAGVRAQAVTPSGKLAEDFLIESSPQMVHVINAPSPAATSAFNVGQIVADRLFELRTANRSTS